ncbi:cytochrome b [Suttonella sp. R2A3]|uniref:cytochrome b n=1 Tax=Suttonella sp. R2A3 TaxID=2908648 RepID=UPI001F383CC7|nr:cytochrome b [Suttonella sp. R2A3]UJF23838.1 cytochrome b [Suttonella sp. R2A3]
MIGNSSTRYGVVHVMLHWLMAVLIAFLFGSGLYMVTLGYYDAGYHTWPVRHKAIGFILAVLLIWRLIWLVSQKKPRALATHARWEIGLAHATHALMYIALLVLVSTGYLIATAKNTPIDVFGWFRIPAMVDADKQSEWLGQVHLYAAWSLIAMVVLHVLGALKHAVIDKDDTLKRIFGCDSTQ